jgi:hypothetical protein
MRRAILFAGTQDMIFRMVSRPRRDRLGILEIRGKSSWSPNVVPAASGSRKKASSGRSRMRGRMWVCPWLVAVGTWT